MTYYNPFQAAPQNNQFAPRNSQQPPQFNPEQFRQFAITLNDNALAQFAQIARQQGISEQDIQAGIRYIKSL